METKRTYSIELQSENTDTPNTGTKDIVRLSPAINAVATSDLSEYQNNIQRLEEDFARESYMPEFSSEQSERTLENIEIKGSPEFISYVQECLAKVTEHKEFASEVALIKCIEQTHSYMDTGMNPNGTFGVDLQSLGFNEDKTLCDTPWGGLLNLSTMLVISNKCKTKNSIGVTLLVKK
jgi:hypothetical protein